MTNVARRQYLAENGDLLEAAHDKMNVGWLHESLQYQLQLQQNLIYLATHADDDPALQRLVFRRPQQPAAARSDVPAGPASLGAPRLRGRPGPAGDGGSAGDAG